MFNPIQKNKQLLTGATGGAGSLVALKRAGLSSLVLYILFSILALMIPGSERSFFPPYVALPVTMEDTSGLLLIGSLVVSCAAALFALYIYSLRQTGPDKGAVSSDATTGVSAAKIAFTFAVGFHLLMVFFPTLLSTDLFDYVRHGRIFAVHGANPLTVPAIFFQQDPFFNLGGWVSTGSVYGPLHAFVSGGLALVSGDGVGTAFIVFKSFYIAVNIVNLILIWKLAARLVPGSEAKALVFFGWNPFVVIMVAANGHNDILMLALVLAAVLCYLDRRLLLGVLCLTLATLVKFITLPLLVLYIALVVRQAPTITRRLLAGLMATGIALGTTLLSYVPFWEGWDTFDYLTRVGNKTGYTIATLLNGAVEGGLDLPRTATTVILALPLAAYVAWKLFKISDIREYIYASAVIAFFIPLVMFWFQPWYLLLAMGLVALKPRGALYAALIVFSISVLFYDNFWWQSPIRMDIQKLVRVLVVFGPPLAVLLYMQLRASGRSSWRRFATWSLEGAGGRTRESSPGPATVQLTPVRMALEMTALLAAAAVPMAVAISSSAQLRSLVDLLLAKLRLLLFF